MARRMSVMGRGQGLDGDITTTGAVCISSLPQARQGNRSVLRQGDVTTALWLALAWGATPRISAVERSQRLAEE